MTTKKSPDRRRGDMAFIFAIVLGLAVGILVKRVRLGLVLGLGLGLLIIVTGMLRSTKR